MAISFPHKLLKYREVFMYWTDFFHPGKVAHNIAHNIEKYLYPSPLNDGVLEEIIEKHPGLEPLLKELPPSWLAWFNEKTSALMAVNPLLNKYSAGLCILLALGVFSYKKWFKGKKSA